MEDLKEFLNENPSEEERLAAETVSKGLRALHIAEKVKTATEARAAWHKRRFWWRIAIASILVLATGLMLLLWSEIQKKETASSPEDKAQEQLPSLPAGDTMPQENQETPALRPTDEATPTKRPTSPPPPIAQAQAWESLPPPSFAAPTTYLRGNTTASAEELANKALLDKIWYTDYPLTGLTPEGDFVKASELLVERNFTQAYARLERLERQRPNNDTLAYLKAYCLMELGQGQEALMYLNQISTAPPAWDSQMEWYRGLSLLHAGKKTEALAVFKKIAQQKKHPYRLYAQKVLAL